MAKTKPVVAQIPSVFAVDKTKAKKTKKLPLPGKIPAEGEPVEYLSQVVDSGLNTYQKRMLVGTPTTGLIRMEWAAARYGCAIPANWSKVDMIQTMTSMIPLRYSIADAQNIIVQSAIEGDFKWLLLIEHDTIPPPDLFIRLNDYMREEKYPVISGLYYTRSEPAEPMVYRGRGNSYFTDWKLGDKVMTDGVPTGMLLLNMKLVRAVYEDSAEYLCGGIKVRRVFDSPSKTWYNEEKGSQEALVGTSDLDFCSRVIEGDYMKKAGFKEFAVGKTDYPFMVDTNIACDQIEHDGTRFPLGGIANWCLTHGNVNDDGSYSNRIVK
jgi:hypothetical protein